MSTVRYEGDRRVGVNGMNMSRRAASMDEDRENEEIDRVVNAKPTRLSVNISRDTLEALQEIVSDKSISMTEAVRRLVGYGIIVYRANKDGRDVLLRRDGKLEKIFLVD